MDYAIFSWIRTKIMVAYNRDVVKGTRLYNQVLAECKRIKEASCRGEEVFSQCIANTVFILKSFLVGYILHSQNDPES